MIHYRKINKGGTVKNKVLWAVKIGDEDWQEQIITDTTSTPHLKKAKVWALKNGFNRLRVAIMGYADKPDFSRIFNR